MPEKGLSLYRLLLLSGLILILIWRGHNTLLPSLARNLEIVSKMPALQTAAPLFLSGHWSTCQASIVELNWDQEWEDLPMGLLSQLDCPSSVAHILQGQSLKNLSDVDIFWFGYALMSDGHREAAINVWRERPLISGYWVNMATMNRASPATVDNLTNLANEISPGDSSIWLKRGLLLRALKPEEAVQAFQHVIDLNPQTPDGYLQLGELRQAQKHYSVAIDLCDHATQLTLPGSPAHSQAYLCLGKSAYYDQDWARAERVFLSMLEWKPDDASAMLWLGRTYQSLKRYELASQYLRQTIELAQEQSLPKLEGNAWYDLGHVLNEQGMVVEAIAAFQQMLILLPDAPSADYIQTFVNSLEKSLNKSCD